MFRAISCPSSEGQIVLIQHLVSSLSVSDRPVHRTVTVNYFVSLNFFTYDVDQQTRATYLFPETPNTGYGKDQNDCTLITLISKILTRLITVLSLEWQPVEATGLSVLFHDSGRQQQSCDKYQMLQIQLFALLMMSDGTTRNMLGQFPDKINCVTLHLVVYILEYYYDAWTHEC